MVDDRTERNIRRAAELVAEADALLITAGAGMSVDSGLPDFRGSQGFWRAYPPLEKLGISFEQMAQPHWFAERPEMAWAFYGHRQQLYRETKPHVGYSMLLDWGRAMPHGYFVVTSNVDGHFQFAGYPGQRILEQHGSIHRYQCTRPCGRSIWHYDVPNRWPELPPDLKIDMATMTARGQLPLCPRCGALARPNVLMFGDDRWLEDVRRVQQERLSRWLEAARRKRIVVLECGAGTTVGTIRALGERIAGETERVKLVRINPDAVETDEPVIAIRLGALEALRRIEAALPEELRRRARDAPREEPHLGMLDEAEDAPPGTPLRYVAEGSYSIKLKQMYANAWRFKLASGVEVWLEKLHVERNHLDFVMGSLLPSREHPQLVLDRAKEFARKNFYEPEPVVVTPRCYDPDSTAPILPPLWFAAQIRSHTDVNDEEAGSIMNLIWFAEIDDEKSIKAFVEEALRQVDWMTQASGWWS